MTTELTDRIALERHRARAVHVNDADRFLHIEAARLLEERLSEVNRRFTAPAVVGPFPAPFTEVLGPALAIADTDVLALQPAAHDLVVHAMSLHWSNDPVGQMIQCRRALKPDGLFLAVAFGGRTLHELRAVLAQAEADISGGLSPRVAPMADIRDLGGLLQRAGLSMPVADSLSFTVSYTDLAALARDLRLMGETNALSERLRRPTPRAVFDAANRVYSSAFPAEGSRIRATFELVFLTGWAPDESQPKPLRPGSASTRLAEALGTEERPAGDIALPKRN